MTTQSAYSSSDPEVLAAFDAADAAAAEFSRQCLALKAEFGQEAWYSESFNMRRFCGFGDIPEGIEGVAWRQSKQGSWWPKQTTKEGKALVKRFEKVVMPDPKMPGMSSYVADGMTFRYPGAFRHDDVVWVSWSCSHDVCEMRGAPRPNLDQWERRKLSEYFTARETFEAQRAVDNVDA